MNKKLRKSKKYNPNDYWNKVAKRINERGETNFLAGDQSPYYDYQRFKFIKEFSKIDFSKKAVLEIGCGPGGNLKILSEMGARRIVGCDISENMINLSSKNLAEVNPKVELFVTDGSNIPLEDNSIDISYTSTVLMHNKDEKVVEKLTQEISRCTKDRVFLFETISNQTKVGYEYARRNLKHHILLMKKCGMELKEVKYINIFYSRWATEKIRQYLDYENRIEGEPLHHSIIILQSLALKFTSILDKLFIKKHGLAKMEFAFNN